MLFFSYSLLACGVYGLLTGTVGFLIAYAFVRRIYGYVAPIPPFFFLDIPKCTKHLAEQSKQIKRLDSMWALRLNDAGRVPCDV